MKNFIVTIAREYGSGGRLIGQQLAEELGVEFYDRKLIALAAKESGFAEEFIEKMEQKKHISFLYNLYMTSQELPASEQIFIAESRVIQNLAEKQSCVIVGRCADYVLREKKNCLKVFIHAPLEQRIKRIRTEYHEETPSLEDYVQKQDKNRASYYNFFTQNKWGKAQNYHLSIDSSMGIPVSVEIIKKLVDALQGGET